MREGTAKWIFTLPNGLEVVTLPTSGTKQNPINFMDNDPFTGVTRTWLKLYENRAFIRKGYAWNGCSPKWVVFDLIIGTPDGSTNVETLLPKAYTASLIHDALYQFFWDPNMPYTRKQMDSIFYAHLKANNYLWAKVYFWAVRLFGWISLLSRKPTNTSMKRLFT